MPRIGVMPPVYDGDSPPLVKTHRSLGDAKNSFANRDDLEREGVVKQLLSIRVVLVVITITTVIAMGIGMILLSVNAQNEIIDNLSSKIESNVGDRIINEFDVLFGSVDSQLRASRLMFKVSPNFTVVPPGTNPFLAYPDISEYFWSIVRQRPLGCILEFDFLDGRFFGMEALENVCDTFWTDKRNGSLIEGSWKHSIDVPMSRANFSAANAYFIDYKLPDNMNAPPYPWIYNTSRDFLNSCDGPTKMFDLFAFSPAPDYLVTMISNYMALCNAQNELIGTMAISIGLYSIKDMLQTITTNVVDGKILIMDSKQRLVATSTGTRIFQTTKQGFVQSTIFDTKEQWVIDVVPKLDGNYGVQKQTVSINNTEYFLIVTRYQFNVLDWYVVMLLTEQQFLGNSYSYFVKCIIAATIVSVVSVAIVSLVTWATTKPLFMLATDLQRMSKLDLELSDMNTPRLLEVGRLYKSVIAMYIALRSFKKFVPDQVISKIIRNRREVTPELSPAKITIMFQDIEGFTSLSETVDPVTLARLTSEYMEVMTEIIDKHGGTIDKYIGDCIMSLFNAPEELPNHPLAATKAAIECITTLAKKNQVWKTQYGCVMNCRIGINTGEVLIGNMGSDYRMNYTAFGDNVNVAARLEGANKHFGSRILISKAVYRNFAAHTDLPFAVRKLAKVRVSGKSLPTSVYEVRGDINSATNRLFQNYKEALLAFKNQQFSLALDLAHKALSQDPSDKATKQLIGRIEAAAGIIDLPPDWTYVEDLSKL